MTYEEALDEIQTYMMDEYGCAKLSLTALGKAVEAVNRQIPKKTRYTGFGMECSVCRSLVVIRGCARFSFCPYCGNRIDWSGVTE